LLFVLRLSKAKISNDLSRRSVLTNVLLLLLLLLKQTIASRLMTLTTDKLRVNDERRRRQSSAVHSAPAWNRQATNEAARLGVDGQRPSAAAWRPRRRDETTTTRAR